MPVVLYCPERKELAGKRLVFLAGPTRWAPPWRHSAIDYLLPRVPIDTVICSPERRDDGDAGPYSAPKKQEQMDWERDHLKYTHRVQVIQSVILFWLPLKVEDPRGHNYGQRTQSELAYAAMVRWLYQVNVAIGAEEGYHGLASTMHTFSWYSANPPILHHTLKEVCDEALVYLKR